MFADQFSFGCANICVRRARHNCELIQSGWLAKSLPFLLNMTGESTQAGITFQLNMLSSRQFKRRFLVRWNKFLPRETL